MAVLRVREAFAFDEKSGVQRVLRPGDLVDSKDPAVKGRAHLFEPVETTVDRTTDRSVEQATAAPGERRGSVVPAKKTAKTAAKKV